MLTSSYQEMMEAKKFLPFMMGYLPEEIVEKARKELNETDETRGPALIELRKIIIAEKKLTCPTDDAYLLQFLRARKFDVRKAFNLLQRFYEVKKEYPECYDDYDFDSLRIGAQSGAATYLPYRTPDGCVVMMIEFTKWNCIESDMIVAMRMLTLLLLYFAEDPVTQVCGVRFLVNVRGASLRHIRCLTPRYIHLFSKALRNCMPNRFKGIHIFNESTIFHYVWSILKIFLTEKIKKRVHFHGDNLKQLHKYIPKEVLPEEYGGSNLNFNGGDWSLKAIDDFLEKAEVLLASGYRD